MCNTLAGLVLVSSLLLFAAGSHEDPVCTHASCGQIGDALSLLQKSAVGQRDSSVVLDMKKEFQDAVARINARFGTGRPSKKLDEAGVVIHAFDGDEEPGADADGGNWFASLDHWSASVINARVPYMYLGNPESDLQLHAGFVVSPESVAAHLLCSYDRDGLTGNLDQCTMSDAGERRADCVPGCIGLREYGGTTPQLRRQWCSTNETVQISLDQSTSIDETAPAIPADDHCAWPANALDVMMEQQESQAISMKRDPTILLEDLYQLRYNEIILDRFALEGTFPKSIEAIYFVTGSAALSPKYAKKGEEDARAAQRLILQKYGQHVPLVRFKSFSAKAPFELVSEPSA